jgi:hypothetical protein
MRKVTETAIEPGISDQRVIARIRSTDRKTGQSNHEGWNTPSGTLCPVWPDYFARTGQPDAITWQYKGHRDDTVRIWKAFYMFVFGHPIVACRGMQQFLQSLGYRIFGEITGDRLALIATVAAPAVVFFAPFAVLPAVGIAMIPILKRKVPPLFQPFSYTGWCNYCIMLALVFIWHGFKQQQMKIHPMSAIRHSSKIFWQKFFAANLKNGMHATQILSTFTNGRQSSPLPRMDVVIKPEVGGAGHKLRSLEWDEFRDVFVCNDIEQGAAQPRQFTPYELEQFIELQGASFIVEARVMPRKPLPISSLRVLTLRANADAELLSAAFLVAKPGSPSTAYFDLDSYLIDFNNNCIGQPVQPGSDARYSGTPLPELEDVVAECMRLHNLLYAHIQISWDIILSQRGPVFLEGNVFPPGCDYKLSIFKNERNINYLKTRILANC